MGGETLSVQTSTMAGYHAKCEPKLDFYIVRRDGTHVPMIALDEIDPRFRVTGLPKTLTAYDVEKWNMGRVGDIIPGPRMTYEVVYVGHQKDDMVDSYATIATKGPSSLATTSCDEQDASARQSPTGQIQEEHCPVGSITTSPTGGPTDTTEDHFDQAAKQHKVAMTEHPSKTKDAMTPGVYGKKKYCTYWIRTGNCDYVQEGCKYLHIIPDEETRHSIGIRDMPRWAKEDLPAPDAIQRNKDDRPAIKHDWRRDRAVVSEASNGLKHSNKKFTPSVPTFLDKPNNPKESKSAVNSKMSLNPAAQSFESSLKPVNAGSPVATPQHIRYDGHTGLAAFTDSPSQKKQSPRYDGHTGFAAFMGSPKVKTQPDKIEMSKTGKPKAGNVTTQHETSKKQGQQPSIEKPKYYAPDRMPRLPSSSQSGFGDPWNTAKTFAPVTYQNSPAPSPWPSQTTLWKPVSSGPESNATGHVTNVSGFRTPSSLFDSLALGQPSDDAFAEATGFMNSGISNGVEGFKTSANDTGAIGTPRAGSVSVTKGATTSMNSRKGTPNVGGVFHPRLFAREGEPKFAIAPVERYEPPSESQD